MYHRSPGIARSAVSEREIKYTNNAEEENITTSRAVGLPIRGRRDRRFRSTDLASILSIFARIEDRKYLSNSASQLA